VRAQERLQAVSLQIFGSVRALANRDILLLDSTPRSEDNKPGHPMPASTGFNSKDVWGCSGFSPTNLKRSNFIHAEGLQQGLKDISISDLTWRDPIASQPLQNMKPVIPEIIQEKCNEFVGNFSIEILDELPHKLSHNKTWKEPEEVLVEITKEILNTL
ncbi:8158_t:CDS:2, partial [Ambispora leptoticha]